MILKINFKPKCAANHRAQRFTLFRTLALTHSPPPTNHPLSSSPSPSHPHSTTPHNALHRYTPLHHFHASSAPPRAAAAPPTTQKRFIVRDNRKIGEIIEEDGNTEKGSQLKLSRRASEFKGTLKLLCFRGVASRLANLEYVSVYNCGLRSVAGLRHLATTPLRRLNLASNDLGGSGADGASGVAEDPLAELAMLPRLTELWLEDNGLSQLSPALRTLTDLKVLRLSNNRLTSLGIALDDADAADEELALDADDDDASAAVVKDDGGAWLTALTELVELAVDANQLRTLPASVCTLTKLETLVARQNALTALPTPLPTSLVHINVRLCPPPSSLPVPLLLPVAAP